MNKTILNFDRKNELLDFVRNNPTEDGYYLTIRIGLSGIYQMINEWKNGQWQANVLDASTTICRSRKQINIKTEKMI